MDYLIVIPALNPERGLIGYVDTLLYHGYENIVVVDDGSRDDCRFIFDEIEAKSGCRILRHEINLGKGRALKDAMRLYVDTYMSGDGSKKMGGIITVDSDGQHIIEDVNAVAKAMNETSDSLILGVRSFDTGNVPPKSMFGNKCTRVALKLFIGGDVHDTQTGLRGIPNCLIERYSNLPGERFEYETKMLIDAIQTKTKITEVPIETVYINDNSETHFNPIIDSIKIYSVILGTFFKYVLSSLSSFIIDYSLFCVLFYTLSNASVEQNRSIWISTATARVCSSLFNYMVNKTVVFKSKRGYVTLLMYYMLCITQMAASAALVSLVNMARFIPVQAAKIVVDCILFLISYRVQKGLIFKETTDK